MLNRVFIYSQTTTTKREKKKTFWKWLNVSAFNTNFFFFCNFSFTNILLNLYVLPFSIKCKLIALHYLFIFFRRFGYDLTIQFILIKLFSFFHCFWDETFWKVFMYIPFYTLFLNFFYYNSQFWFDWLIYSLLFALLNWLYLTHVFGVSWITVWSVNEIFTPETFF